MRKIVISFFVALLIGMPLQAAASENGLFGAPIGGTDINNALLPPPGLYGALLFLGTNGSTYEGNNSQPTDYPASLSAANYGGGVFIVYPFKLWGGHFASQFQLADQQLWQKMTIPHVGLLKGQGVGLGDSYADLLSYSKFIGHLGVKPLAGLAASRIPYGLTLDAAMGMEIPLGSYSEARYANEGHNTTIFIPSIAATYAIKPILPKALATLFDVRWFYETSLKNPATSYQGGKIYDIDFAATERYKNLQAGIAGAYAKQFTDDVTATGAIATPDGNRYEKLILGPVASLYVPKIRTNFKLKTTFGTHNTNTYLLNTVVLVATFQLHGFGHGPKPHVTTGAGQTVPGAQK